MLMVLCDQGGQGLIFAVSGVPGLKKRGGREERGKDISAVLANVYRALSYLQRVGLIWKQMGCAWQIA